MACILFVDDDPFTLETLAKAMEVFGHQALLASTGEEGLEIAAGQSPDLIFSDMSLPDMDGLTLVKALKESAATAQIPVMILSASPEIDAVEVAKAAGATAYLNKPIRLQNLLNIIDEFTAKGEEPPVSAT
jgi:CheY-like chemotaxis protein